MDKYYYTTTPIRNRCQVKCKYTGIYVGSISCRDDCEFFGGYGKDEKGKFVRCNKVKSTKPDNNE